MHIRKCGERTEWEAWQAASGRREFLQSWEWGEFQRSVGRAPLRLQACAGGQVVAQMQGFMYPLPAGMQYVYFPRVSFGEAANSAVAFLKEKNSVFIRAEPTDGAVFVFCAVHTVRSSQPRHTLIIDIALPEEKLLSGMHPKTRYNIGLSSKKGVDIREGKDAAVFVKLMRETATRDHFSAHPDSYYRRMLESPLSHQLTAWYSGEPVASHMYIVYNRRCTYLHGASSGAHREVMSPYALQWRAIQMARERGDKEFDLWGVAVPAHGSGDAVRTFHHYSWDAHDPWSGITRFKAGFGGSVMSYPEAIEIPLRRAPYILYRAARVFRRRVSLLYARHS